METLGFPGRQGCKLLRGMSTALQLERSQEAGHPSQGKYCCRPKNTFMETEVHTGLEAAKLGSCVFFLGFLFPLENLKRSAQMRNLGILVNVEKCGLLMDFFTSGASGLLNACTHTNTHTENSLASLCFCGTAPGNGSSPPNREDQGNEAKVGNQTQPESQWSSGLDNSYTNNLQEI